MFQVSLEISKIEIEEDNEETVKCYMRKFFHYYEVQ